MSRIILYSSAIKWFLFLIRSHSVYLSHKREGVLRMVWSTRLDRHTVRDWFPYISIRSKRIIATIGRWCPPRDDATQVAWINLIPDSCQCNQNMKWSTASKPSTPNYGMDEWARTTTEMAMTRKWWCADKVRSRSNSTVDANAAHTPHTTPNWFVWYHLFGVEPQFQAVEIAAYSII